jgi:hypothetical protein
MGMYRCRSRFRFGNVVDDAIGFGRGTALETGREVLRAGHGCTFSPLFTDCCFRERRGTIYIYTMCDVIGTVLQNVKLSGTHH